MDLIEKQRRVAVLKKIDAWDKARCAKCAEGVEGNSNTAIKCKCKAAVEVRKLGIEYEEGSRLKRQGRVAELLSTFKDPPLSVDTYDMLKELEVEDKVIMRNLNISNSQFRDWKFEVGRAKNPTRISAALQQDRQEYTKWRIIAQQGGISSKNFHMRVRRDGLSYEQAANPADRRSVR